MLAGFVCGYALAIAVTPVMAVALVRARPESDFVRRAMPEGSSLIAVSLLIHTFAFFALTAVGILLGVLLAGLETNSPGGGLGSPNGVFTGFILATTAIAIVPLAIAIPRLRRMLALGGLVFAGSFGWLMPYLSLLGPNGS